MATEEDRDEEREQLGNDPLEPPSAEQLEEENPVESPAADQEGAAEPEHDSPQERASMSMETGGQVARSTEGQTIGGTDKTPDDKRAQ